MKLGFRRGGAGLGLLGLLAGIVMLALLVSSSAAAPVCSAGTCTETFAATGAAQTWVVPAGVTSATFEVSGAQGGALSTLGVGGAGGKVTATIAVVPGEVYEIRVGGKGDDAFGPVEPPQGGFNGGGNGGRGGDSLGTDGSGGSGGGGASDVRAGSCAQTSSCGLADRVIVGGGGGGGASSGNGGAGANPDGGAGAITAPLPASPAAGGKQTAPGAGGPAPTPPACSFGGGIEAPESGSDGAVGGGSGGAGGAGADVPGSSLRAGNGGAGGGGGYYGGGGASGGCASAVSYAGGGGSSFGPAGATFDNGARQGDGLITITYTEPTPPPTPTPTPTIGALPAGHWKNNSAATTAFLPKLLGNYNVDTFTKARAVFNATKCGSSKPNNAIGCLAGQLLATKLSLANGSLACPSILQAVADSDAFLKTLTVNGVPGINYVGPSGSYTLTAAQRALALSLKNKLETYNSNVSCP